MENIDELYRKLSDFCQINEQFSISFKILQANKTLTKYEQIESLLDYIAKEIIIIPQYFPSVIEAFAKELPKLLIQAVFFTRDFPFSRSRHIVNCVLLSKIVRARPDLKSFAQKYFKKYPSPFEEGQSSPVKAKRSRIALAENVFVRDTDVVEACYFLLRSDPEFYRQKWKWSVFIKKYSQDNGYEVAMTWLACHTIGIVLGLNESSLQSLIAQKLPEDVNIKLTIEFDKNTGLVQYPHAIHPLDQQPLISTKTKNSSEVVAISGIYIPAVNEPKKQLLVDVPSTYNNLRKIAIGLSAGKALCLQGPVGSGKTSTVEHLAAATGRILGDTFIKVQLGDQTDSKMLLGTYRCTDTPGEFIWQPGVLTQSVIQGSWLLLEDIDLASMDIASVLVSLLENKALTVPGYRDSVPVTPGFQLIVTQRLITSTTGRQHKRQSNALHLLDKQLLQITIDPLSDSELKHILRTRYPQFDTVADRLVSVFGFFSGTKNENSSRVKSSGRLISTRDFFKWCARSAIDFDVKSQESALKVLQDAIDVFCCSFSDASEALSLAKEVSSCLGIINQKAEYFFNSYKPNLKLTSNSLSAGRVSLVRDHSIHSKRAKFCFTRPAAVLLERIMCCVKLREPVLLVGETGTGKTSSVQYLANTLGKKLIVINMNQQSDSADLLGGFKPVDLKIIISPIRREFETVFRDFFDVDSNREFLNKLAFAFNKEKFAQMVSFMLKSTAAALRRLSGLLASPGNSEKKRKDRVFLKRWQAVSEKLKKVEVQLKQANALYFAFIEGSLVKAVQDGSWVLLDEINLANAETLECLSGLLEGTEGSLCLLERGDKKPVQRHPDFTLFACMNPATNVGKKDLPTGLRNRFTEFYVEELAERSDLIHLVNSYLDAMNLKEKDVAKIVGFYLHVRTEMDTSLCDGLGHKPHFSLRSLCRALTIAGQNPCGNFKRSLYEAFCLSFLTQLDSDSYKIVEESVTRYLIGDGKQVKAILKQPIPEPKEPGAVYLQFEGYWIKKGELDSVVPEDYILTDSVRKNLKDLVRVVSIGKLPVLLQGDTSVGKTSLITYLAKSSGNKCVRINNHEHTDLQEYIGSYVADASGKLVFREGVLVEAMRKGHWIILDELNLAPTEVLEALNRVLDDNRELFVPETQETIKADPNFILFATQNPPGAYGGRKMLSRAFRNRFVELHFNEIPRNELEFILHRRCAMPPSYAKKMIAVMSDLQVRRRGSAAFAGKQGFITLRDLFRWGERYRLAQNPAKLYDWNQHLADEGYLVLAGRVRKADERKEIVDVLQRHWQRDVRLENLFSLHEKTSTVTRHILEKIENNSARHPTIVWTLPMRKLAVLVGKALEFKEPVLLVGETGGGKTTICQLIAENNGQELAIVNCHMHTESGDFIGGLRPVRDHSEKSNSLFEWVDGPLLQAMVKGNVFLADEISLADDSVLERLNSLLEPERTLLLAEKGIDLNNAKNSETVVARSEFAFVATMNPGGDFGKKELSPALRNRFTEIWCDSCTDRDDLISIIDKNLQVGESSGKFGEKIMDFIEWFRGTEIGKKYTISIRDVLTWVNFVNACSAKLPIQKSYLHGAYLVFLDSLGSGVTSTESAQALDRFKKECDAYLRGQVKLNELDRSSNSQKLVRTDSSVGIDPFYVPCGEEPFVEEPFSFEAPTTVSNTLNVLRGMQLNKAILLEGSPGVGKTSLVTALARISRNKLFRVNLSDQTDISDLFGADLPTEGGTGCQFSWRDGPLLQALKQGSWILLDELNLASQSVLEGLNACLDHRGEIFIPELGKTFHVKTGTRFFACQNPMKQGGSRRGLPKSFLNRFIQVYVSAFTRQDMEIILCNRFPTLPEETISAMIEFNYKLSSGLDQHLFGHKGAPWECNLRDLTRWCQATLHHFEQNRSENRKLSPESTVQLVYVDRMRSAIDKCRVEKIFEEVMKHSVKGSQPVAYINGRNVYFGDASLERGQDQPNEHVLREDRGRLILRGQLGVLRSLVYCVNQSWMAILVGSTGVGKSCVVKTLADLAGKTLRTLPVTSAMDTTDILGGFEQTNYSRHLEEIVRETEKQTLITVRNLLMEEKSSRGAQVLEYWEEYLTLTDSTTATMEEEVQLFLRRVNKLEALLKEIYMKANSADQANQVLHLLDRCSRIFDVVNADKSLSAGGRFEWVDSVLVKCLQEGSWLLVDNVNLCSAAVLDRLNALLEPNGVLTVSEKGVDESGRMFEVKPHENFRIFLTMDPKNGEISRAMRNRGVEIYMLNESEQPHSNRFDIKSLIDLEGLSHPDHITALLHIHEFISSLVLSEKPTSVDLLRSSSLIAQQIRHGVDVSRAFYDACLEVYYKTRNCSEFNCNNVPEVIKDGIDRCLTVVDNSTDFFNASVTLNSRELVRWSNLEKVKQQSGIYGVAFRQFNDNVQKYRKLLTEVHYMKNNSKTKNFKDLTIWSDLETVKKQNDFFDSINFYALANLLVINYTLTSAEDVQFRTEYLKTIVNNPEWQATLERFDKIIKYFESSNACLPYNSKWIDGVYDDDYLKASYALQVQVHKLKDILELKYSPNRSLFEYLIAVEKNEVSDVFNNAICSKYLRLRNEYFIFLRRLCVHFVGKPQNEGTLVKVLELVSWRQALNTFLTSVQLPDVQLKSPKMFVSKLDMLTIYYKWFLKYSVDGLVKFLGAAVPKSLEDILSQINKSVHAKFPDNYKIANNYKKHNDVPPFYTSESQLAALDLLQTYDLFDSRNDIKKIISFFISNSDNSLVELKRLLHPGFDADLSLVKTFDAHTDEIHDLTPQQWQILPLADAIIQKLSLKVIQAMGSSKDLKCDSLTSHPLLPVEFKGVLLRYGQTKDKRLRHEIKKYFYVNAVSSPSARWDRFVDGASYWTVAGVGPTFFSTLVRILVDLEGERATLNNFQDLQEQLRFAQLTLWDNMHALSDEEYDFVCMQLRILSSDAESFMDRLEKALTDTTSSISPDATLNTLVGRIRANYEKINADALIVDEKQSLLPLVADLHVDLGFVELYLNSFLPPVDPLAKKAMKKNHLGSVLGMFEQMKSGFDMQNRLFTNDEPCRHPYYASVGETMARLRERIDKYGESVNVGAQSFAYSFVVQQIKHASNNVIKTTLLDDLFSCSQLIQNLNADSYTDDVENKINAYLDRFESIVPSLEKIFQDWKQYRGSYPDIVEPLLANLAQFLYGFKLKVYIIRRGFVRFRNMNRFGLDLEKEVVGLVALPSLDGNSASLDVAADHYTRLTKRGFVNHFLSDEEPLCTKEGENIRLLKCGIQEYFNQCVINAKNSETNKELIGKFNNLVGTFVSLWNKQEESKENEKSEAESIYKTRTKCDDKTEDEQIDDELKQLFPNHHVLDFSDLHWKTLDDSDPPQVAKPDGTTFAITEEDFRFVVDLHSKLFKNFVKTEWWTPEVDKNVRADFITPLIEKYKTVRRLTDEHGRSFTYGSDLELFGSLAVLVDVSKCYGVTNRQVTESFSPKTANKRTKDFYKDPDVEEVKTCLHVLQEVKMKVEELLREWPDQPTLNTIVTVIDRIMDFDIRSPISRYLTGFDILLAKCHEWEQVAHSGVSLIDITPELTAQIITWRKLELSRWKDLLNTTFNEMARTSTKWWLYMYNLSNQYVAQQGVTESDLIDIIQKFMTKSPLAEFQARLQLLLEFHCRAIASPQTDKSRSLVSVLWNVFNYFDQFSNAIATKIRDLRTPIERKLKDYVNIVKWKDVSYWSVKDTVDKSHKTLHKFVREYRDLLLQPVTPFLANPALDHPVESVGIWDRPQRQNPKAYHYTLDADSYVVKASPKDYPYLAKARKVCKETILGTAYPNLVQSLDGFTTDVIETSSHLRKLEVDTTLTKEKQKSQAKNILNQKHRALADLFQTLTKIGVSYKTGLIDMKVRSPTEEFTIKPIDLTASFSYLSVNRTDEKMLIIWDSCEMYYYRCLMRYDVLQSALLAPAQDLGRQNVDRCKGFAANLVTICQQQKKDLVQVTRHLYTLRVRAQQMRNACDCPTYITSKSLAAIKNVLNSTAIVINQIQLVLDAFPEEATSDETFMAVPLLKTRRSAFKRKEDDDWSKATKCVNTINSLSSKLLNIIQKAAGYCPDIDNSNIKFVPFAQQDVIYNDLDKIAEAITNLKLLFEPLKIVESLNWLLEKVSSIMNEEKIESNAPPRDENLDKLVNKFTKMMLLVFQNLYKKYTNVDDSEVAEEAEDSEDINLKDDHLKTLISRNLSSDLAALELKRMCSISKQIAEILLGSASYASEENRSSIAHCLTLFEQLLQLTSYFVTQEVAAYRTTCKLASIVMNIFIDLASKGFCIPPELSDELDKEGVSKPSDGMGLGEGQGERDVSDKIESEDQLEDAQPAGQEKENTEDPDCQEEDKGIEMSEDFDSKLQDKKPRDEDDDEEQSDNSDAEEQMGETEKGADQLDQEIWGDDKEDDNQGDGDDEQKEEDGPGGKKDGEDQLEAKDTNKSKEKSRDKDLSGDREEDSEKNEKEINEMDEPEYDDEQTDPYHGNQPDLPEPEPMDLPDDLRLDEGEENDGEVPEENPFDIDEMKEQQMPDDKLDENKLGNDEEQRNDEEKEFSSDDEDITRKDEDDNEGVDNDDDDNTGQDKVDDPDMNPEGDDDTEESADAEDNGLDQNPSAQENIEAMEVDDAQAADKTQATSSENLKSDQPIDETQQEDKPDKDGTGQSQMEDNESGHSVQGNAQQEAKHSNSEQDKQEKRKERPGESNLKRSLGDVNQSVEKKLKTTDALDNQDGPEKDESEVQKSEMYQHIKEAEKSEKQSTQVLDAATREQAEEQIKEANHDELDTEKDNEDVEGSKEVPEDDDEIMEVDSGDNLKEKSMKSDKVNDKQKNNKQHPEGDIVEEIKDIEIEGDIVKTSTVPRGGESSHHTQYHLLRDEPATKLTQEEINLVRTQVEQELSTWTSVPTSPEAERTWQKISSVTSSLAQDLSEQLRLVLEPTQASHLKGDFRTGRRINMRKVIPYIASQFRKDRIWLRRTKPSKREYQVVLAIDDSSSMADNHSKELAFESVALISKALSLLESGQLAVVSFGETTEVHHKLTDPFTDKSGVQLLQNFQFDQQKTQIGQLVNFVTEMFDQSNVHPAIPNAKLLLIVSDGRGVFSEGTSYVTQAVRRAKLANVFIVFVIIDNPDSKSSILDIRSPIFKDGKITTISSYMDTFPFSFYMILRDINSLPGVLSDALRQWFEMVTSQE